MCFVNRSREVSACSVLSCPRDIFGPTIKYAQDDLTLSLNATSMDVLTTRSRVPGSMEFACTDGCSTSITDVWMRDLARGRDHRTLHIMIYWVLHLNERTATVGTTDEIQMVPVCYHDLWNGRDKALDKISAYVMPRVPPSRGLRQRESTANEVSRCKLFLLFSSSWLDVDRSHQTLHVPSAPWTAS